MGQVDEPETGSILQDFIHVLRYALVEISYVFIQDRYLDLADIEA